MDKTQKKAEKKLKRIRDSLDKGANALHLLDCTVAGTSYRKLDTIAPGIRTNTLLLLCREPDNRYDTKAVMVLGPTGKPLGYVPKAVNDVPSSLLDQSQVLYAKVRDKEWDGSWLRLEISIYMLANQ